jgi:membrane protein
VTESTSHPLDRLEARAGRSRLRLGGHSLALLTVRSARRIVDVRITGLAAEMTYYMVLSLIPLLTALGAGMALIRVIVGAEGVTRMENALVGAVEGVLSPQLSEDVVVPFVQDLLRQERLGIAIGGLVVALWLASRVFRAAIRALDDTYQVTERRKLWQQWLLALGFAVMAVVTVVVLLALVVVGPLLGGGPRIAEWIGAGRAFEVTWAVARWPVVFAVCTAFLMWLHRAGPNVRNTWRQTLPGALAATTLIVILTLTFRYYLDVAGPGGPELNEAGGAVRDVAQFIGAALAGLLYIWLASIAVLLGGVINAEWMRSRADQSTGTRRESSDEPTLPL